MKHFAGDRDTGVPPPQLGLSHTTVRQLPGLAFGAANEAEGAEGLDVVVLVQGRRELGSDLGGAAIRG